MRQITAQTCNAVNYRKMMSKGNMLILYKEKTDLSLVFLHSNLIAAYNHNEENLYIRSAGWQSNTTKERLNGLIDYFGYNLHIYQKDWNWYIRTENGDINFHEAFNAELKVYPDGYDSRFPYFNPEFKFINCNKLNK